MKQVYHGIESTLTITDTNCPLYKNIPQGSKIGRYHSWNAVRENLPDCFTITGEDEDSRIMSIRHKTHAVFGVQYHPESILTPEGKHIISNWLHL